MPTIGDRNWRDKLTPEQRERLAWWKTQLGRRWVSAGPGPMGPRLSGRVGLRGFDVDLHPDGLCMVYLWERKADRLDDDPAVGSVIDWLDSREADNGK